MNPDATLYTNAKVVTMDEGRSISDAFLVVHDRFAALGDAARARAVDHGATVVDLEGRTVVPGLIDAHTHLEASAVSSNRWVNIRNVDHATAVERLTARIDAAQPGDWVIGQAVMGQQIPQRADLDAIAPDTPVVIRGSMHTQTANSAALRLAGMFDTKFDPVGVEIERHPGGEPTGLVKEGYHLFPIPIIKPAVLAGFIEDEIRDHFNRWGITTIYEVPTTSEGMAAFRLLDKEGRLNARISLNPAIKPGLQPLVDDIKHWATMGLNSGFGNDRLWLGAAKLFLDGAGDVQFSIDRDREHPSKWGATTHQFNELVRAILIAYESDIQLWIHAIGEDAQYLALDAVAAAQRLHGGDGDHRTRIEHMFNATISDELIARTKAIDAIPVPNAVYLHLDTIPGLHPYRTLIDHGFMPPGNSDTAGGAPSFQNPWFGVSKMVTRRGQSGRVNAPGEVITIYEGIQTYTGFAAYAGFKEGELGVIKPGALADFAVLTVDPFAIDENELEAIESVLTVVGGAPVWDCR